MGCDEAWTRSAQDSAKLRQRPMRSRYIYESSRRWPLADLSARCCCHPAISKDHRLSINTIPSTAESPHIMRDLKRVAGETRAFWPDALRAVVLLCVVTIRVDAVPVFRLVS